jgi:hypothetical protein
VDKYADAGSGAKVLPRNSIRIWNSSVSLAATVSRRALSRSYR